MADQEPMEGFLCPICIIDLKNPSLLVKHFDECHNDDPEILKSLKDLFGKAKKKILKQEDVSFSGTLISCAKNDDSPEIDWGPQEIGVTKSHTQYFKELRYQRLERYNSETNKILLRLDKLLNNINEDPLERKAYERDIAKWVDDKDIKNCIICAKHFNLTTRKHHCRLCGVVMCKNCSSFVSIPEARKMTSPASTQDDFALSPTSENYSFSDRLVKAGVGLTKIARSPSSNSLNSVFSLITDSASNHQSFRICSYCKNLLDARENLKARDYEKPLVFQFYEKLQSQIAEANKYLEIYYKMWQSLSEGESTYNLRDAEVVRGKIAKVGDSIDLLSKKIAMLINISEESSAAVKQEYKLHQTIRSMAMIFLKNYVIRAPPVPSEEEYEVIKKRRQERVLAQIELEKKMAYEREQKEKQNELVQNSFAMHRSPSSNSSQLILDQSQGWGTSTPPGTNKMISSTSADHPFIEQMRNLRLYIKQAKEACKFEEAAALENNLKELQSAYFTMQENADENSTAQ